MSKQTQMAPDDGGAAFPCEGGVDSGLYPDPGMSLRQWYAGQALPALIINEGAAQMSKPTAAAFVAKEAVAIADAMLAALATGEASR